MKTREEIKELSKDSVMGNHIDLLMLEVLLDIRELLEEKTINVYVTNAHEI